MNEYDDKNCVCPTDKSELEGQKCLPAVDQRNNYFTGKFFCKRDFEIEQDYFRSRNQLQNRLLHGWGIACGLDVEHHEDWTKPNDIHSECARHYVVVTPGVAIDPCGREVILKEPIIGRVPFPCDWHDHGGHDQQQQDADAQAMACEDDDFVTCVKCLNPRPEDPCGHEGDKGRYLLCLEYCEQEIEATVSYCDDKGSKEYNRILERPRVVLLDWEMTEKLICQGWWPDRDQNQHAAHAKGFNGCVNARDQQSDDKHPCDDNPCEDSPNFTRAFVPLALIKLPDPKDPDCDHAVKGHLAKEEPQPHFRIDTCGRTYVGLADESRLTEIVSINWRHGGTYENLNDFCEHTGARLTIRFNNPIIEDGLKFGPNWGSFLVQFDPETDRVEFADGRIELAEDKRSVHFILADHHLPKGDDAAATNKKETSRGSSKVSDLMHHCYVFVSLKCDFILDCNGHAVDGNHIGGAVPCLTDDEHKARWKVDKNQYDSCLPTSGNGSPGGTFDSWFRIK